MTANGTLIKSVSDVDQLGQLIYDSADRVVEAKEAAHIHMDEEVISDTSPEFSANRVPR